MFDKGNWLVGGSSNSTDLTDEVRLDDANCFISELDERLNVVQTSMIGGHQDDEIVKMFKVNDGDYLIFAKSKSFGGDVTGNQGGQDIWIVNWSGFPSAE